MFRIIMLAVVIAIVWAGNRPRRLPLVAIACLVMLLVGVTTVRFNTSKQLTPKVTTVRSTVEPTTVPTPIDMERDKFVSAVKRFVPLHSVGEATTSMIGYQEIFRKNAAYFYDIPKKYGVDPHYLFGLACWTTGFGSSEGAFLMNDLFGDGHSFASVSDSIYSFCRQFTPEDQNEPEVWELVNEIF